MRSDRFLRCFLGAMLSLALFYGRSGAQQPAAPPSATPSAASAAGLPAPGAFAPGVLTVIPPDVDRGDALSVHELVEVRANQGLQWDPSAMSKSRTLYEMAASVAFPQDVYCLELAFKPLRMIEVDVPQPNGRLQRKLVWYMVYRVRNTGVGLSAEIKPDGTYVTAAKGQEPVRFIPEFVLVSHDRARGERVRKAYLDRIVPTALTAIRARELPDGQLLPSTELPLHELRIEAGRAEQGLWGVAMWSDVDPQIDFFSVYVRGLTNAYRWTDVAGEFKLGDPPGAGRQFTFKTLQLNFWRPGDELDQDEREIRFGVAAGRAEFYDSPEGVAYRWVYR
ncbi:MAG: hypothetical protein DCC67_08550 [Planctomycetota bacterium]|nr:MAG: hypothetical protein DCC67_08550 [Planctomycetota bacterium]